jgi:hypothetical protein
MKTLVLAVTVVAALAALPPRAVAQDTTTTPRPPAPDTTTAQPPPPAPAPDVSGTAISPGMTEADVRTRWGDPVAVRTAGQWKFLFYRNEHERRIGFLDTVFLQNGQVVDCVARGEGHIYTGQSSSPEGRYPERTLPTHPAATDSTTRGAVTGVRVSP